MFEGNLQDAGFVSAAQTGGQAGGHADGLKPMEWPVLVARLAAARDLRSVISRRKLVGTSGGAGNFACFTSGETAILNESAPGINRNASVDRKGSKAKVSAAAQEAETGDREL